MSIASAAGIEVPEFYLSDNRQLFVVRRFDRDPAGNALGFEDMAVLTAKRASNKYTGSYEQIARAISLFCHPDRVPEQHSRLFNQVALSCIVGNGDAHLKDFGLLYSDPSANDARLTPAFDIVNTTAYMPEDSLALTLGGSKSIFASRLHLLTFAERLGASDPYDRVRRILEATNATLQKHSDLVDEHLKIQEAIRAGWQQFSDTFNKKPE